jgi:hypothetical protein
MMSELNIRTRILNEAAEIINGERQDDYGDPLENWTCIAEQWSVTSGHKFTPIDVGMFQIQVKLGRAATGNKFKSDTWRDIIGTAAIIAELAAKLADDE